LEYDKRSRSRWPCRGHNAQRRYLSLPGQDGIGRLVDRPVAASDNHTFNIATTSFVDIPVDITSFPGNPYIELVFRITKYVDGLSDFGPVGLLAVEY
jgi:hypothetical protein